MIIKYSEKRTTGQSASRHITQCRHFKNRMIGGLACAAICLHRKSINRKNNFVDCGFLDGSIYKKA